MEKEGKVLLLFICSIYQPFYQCIFGNQNHFINKLTCQNNY